MNKLLIILALLMGIFLPTSAQDEWSIRDQCVSHSDSPPEGWTYSGTILTEGPYGLHGINQNWETPRVMAFLNEDYRGYYFSPDGLWVAQLRYQSTGRCTSGGNIRCSAYISSVRIYSTVEPHVYYTTRLDSWYESGSRLGYPLYAFWWDDETLIVPSNDGRWLGFPEGWINPFTGEWSEWTGIPDLAAGMMDVAPDRQTAVWIHNRLSDSFISIIDAQTGEVIHELVTNTGYIYDSLYAIWNHASDRFVLVYSNPDYDRDLGRIFENPILNQGGAFVLDRDGSVIEVINMQGLYARDWSHDDRMILGVLDGTFHLMMMDDREIINTCIESTSARWSPTTHQIAYVPNGTRDVMVFDVDQWETYKVADHDSRVLFWRNDPE